MDSGATCHMTSEVSDFIPGLLEYMDKHIEVADGHHVIAKQKVQVWINIFDDNRDPFIPCLHSAILAQNLYDGLFSIIKLMSLVHTCLLQKGFGTVYFGEKEKNSASLPHSAQRKHTFLGKIKEMQRQINYHLERKLL